MRRSRDRFSSLIRYSSRLFCAFAALMLTAGFFWTADTPEIGRGLPRNFSEASAVFADRVEEQLNIGLSEAELVLRLKKQGFDFPETGPAATRRQRMSFSRSGFPCRYIWTVRWKPESGLAADVRGSYGAICL